GELGGQLVREAVGYRGQRALGVDGREGEKRLWSFVTPQCRPGRDRAQRHAGASRVPGCTAGEFARWAGRSQLALRKDHEDSSLTEVLDARAVLGGAEDAEPADEGESVE